MRIAGGVLSNEFRAMGAESNAQSASFDIGGVSGGAGGQPPTGDARRRGIEYFLTRSSPSRPVYSQSGVMQQWARSVRHSSVRTSPVSRTSRSANEARRARSWLTTTIART
jgi:hypothetical protein